MSTLDPQEAQQRYAAIQAKEEELKRREQALRDLQLGLEEDDKPNWPSCCPFIHNDIANDIPMKAQIVMKVAFYGQFLWGLCLLMNMLACFGCSGMPEAYDMATYIVFGILFVVLGVPLGFTVNYAKFYTQCRQENLTMCYFLLQLIFFGLNALAAVGPPGFGLAGFLYAIDAIGMSYTAITGFISAILWTLSACLQFFILSKAFILYKDLNGTAPLPSQQA